MERRHRAGLLIPASDMVMEADLWRRLPPHLTLHIARMYMQSTTVAGERKMLEEELEPAARRVASVIPELIIFGCTSAAAIFGLDGDADIARRVEAIAGCRCITVVQAAVAAIRRHAAQRLLLATPYITEIHDRLQDTFREAGLPVIGVAGMGLDHDLKIGAVPPAEIRRFVTAAVRAAIPSPDCVFVSCTTFRALEVAEDLEHDLGIPVVTSNRGALEAIFSQFGRSV